MQSITMGDCSFIFRKAFAYNYAFNLNFYRSTKYRCLKWLIVKKLNYSKI